MISAMTLILIYVVNFPFLDGDVPRFTSYRVYISQLIRLARVSSHVDKLRKTFSKFYRRHYGLVSKFNVGLKTHLHQGLSEPEFYGYIHKFKTL